MARSARNLRKQRSRLSIPFMLVMILLLAGMTSAVISAFEWTRDNLSKSTLFTLKGVSINGNSRISSSDILSVSGLPVGTDSIYTIMSHIVEKRVKSRFRYLEQIEIQRKFVLNRTEGIYGWVNIEVKEREPLAIACSGRNAGSYVIVDKHGFVLEEGKANPEADKKSPNGNMPMIIGVDIKKLKGDVQESSPALDPALNVLTNARSATPELFDRISCIDARDQDNIVVYLQARDKSMPEVPVRLAGDRIEKGLSDILPVIIRREAEGRTTEYIDARFPGAVYCRDGTHSEGR